MALKKFNGGISTTGNYSQFVDNSYGFGCNIFTT